MTSDRSEYFINLFNNNVVWIRKIKNTLLAVGHKLKIVEKLKVEKNKTLIREQRNAKTRVII